MTALIRVRYESIDSYGRGKTRAFKTLKGAQKYAHAWVGKYPTRGAWYAVSDDGVGKITVTGATLSELFPGTE
jgi:hypothetical protein